MKNKIFWFEKPKNFDSIPKKVTVTKAAVSKEMIVEAYLKELANPNTEGLTVYSRTYNRLVREGKPVTMRTIRLVLRSRSKNQ